MAINSALALVETSGNLPVPLHLRNAPTALMKKMGYGNDYKYAHDYPGNFVKQQFLPDALTGTHFYNPAANPQEDSIAARQNDRWK